MQYFDHSTAASSDERIVSLRLECGGAAVDAYWYFVEQMHRGERPVCIGNASAMRVHCHALCTDEESVRKWLEAMFSTMLLKADDDGKYVVSERAEKNIEAYRAKREKASSAANKRWGDADAMRTHKPKQCKRNADAMPTKQNKTKVSTAIRSTKPYAVDGAVADGAAPPPARCPLCGERVWKNTQTGKYRCDSCCDEFAAEKVKL